MNINQKEKFDKKINEFYYAWQKKRIHCLKSFEISGRINEEELQYYCPWDHLIIDYGLIFDTIEPFKWKIHHILKHLWKSHYNECLKLMNDLIVFEKKKLKEGGIEEAELTYVIYIKNMVNYVIKHRFKDISQAERQKIIAGDYKD